jgi:hypothetical protein
MSNIEGVHKDATFDFSWYACWNDVQPFVFEFMIDLPAARTLHLGIGSDSSLVRMLHKAGCTQQTAFDYAQESVDYCRDSLDDCLEDGNSTIHLLTANARILSMASEIFDIVLDKGTLDARRC